MISDKNYLLWLREQPCVACGAHPPSDPAHVRLNGRGGMGMKPKFSAVPLCHQHHLMQHQHGQTTIMSNDMWLYHAGESLRNYLIEST